MFNLKKYKLFFSYVKKKVQPLYKMSLKLFSFLEFDKLLKTTSQTFNNVKTIERIAKLMIQILVKSFDYIYNTGLVLVLYSANDASRSSIPGLSRTSGLWADYVLCSKVI